MRPSRDQRAAPDQRPPADQRLPDQRPPADQRLPDQRPPADQRPAPDQRPAAADTRPYGRMMIFTLLDDKTAEFDRAAEQVAEEVRIGEPDTLVYVIHSVPDAPLQRIFYEIYRNRAAFDAHESKPYMERFTTERRAYVLATNVIELRLKYAKIAPLAQSPQSPQSQGPRQLPPHPQPAQLPPGQAPQFPPAPLRRYAPPPTQSVQTVPQPVIQLPQQPAIPLPQQPDVQLPQQPDRQRSGGRHVRS